MAMSEKKMAKRSIVLAMDAVRKQMERVQEQISPESDLYKLSVTMHSLATAFREVSRS